jgi:hypothetical protein
MEHAHSLDLGIAYAKIGSTNGCSKCLPVDRATERIAPFLDVGQAQKPALPLRRASTANAATFVGGRPRTVPRDLGSETRMVPLWKSARPIGSSIPKRRDSSIPSTTSPASMALSFYRISSLPSYSRGPIGAPRSTRSRSMPKYQAVLASMGMPDPLRAKYREFIGEPPTRGFSGYSTLGPFWDRRPRNPPSVSHRPQATVVIVCNRVARRALLFVEAQKTKR